MPPTDGEFKATLTAEAAVAAEATLAAAATDVDWSLAVVLQRAVDRMGCRMGQRAVKPTSRGPHHRCPEDPAQHAG